ncbi:MAG: hypothetical protein NTW86_29670 [Candidatus Sumerlaeota bacterium]|nr:hypothetical protein [Candidatus Sumerlaeota bacterium]
MPPGLIIALIVAVIVGIIALNVYLTAKRRKALQQWAQSKGLSFRKEKDRGLDNRFPSFSCLREGSDRYAYNIMEGQWDKRPVVAFDYHYETESRDSKGNRHTHNHYLSAIVFDCGLPMKPLLIRPEGLFDKIASFFGAEDINFESAEFSRKFYVKAADKKWAYDVIHQRAMQFLLDNPRFTLQFDPRFVIAYNGRTFKTPDFDAAAKVATGLLDMLPDYVIKQQREGV